MADLDAAERLQHARRGGPLNRQQRVAAAGINRGRFASLLDLRRNPRVVLLDIRRVDDEHEVAGRHAVDEHVVHEGAVEGRQRGIMRLADLQAAGVVARNALDRGERILARNFDFAHVADIEEAGARPHRHMFRGDAGVLDGHVPAAEGNHPRVRRAVPGVQGRFSEFRGDRFGHRGTRGMLCGGSSDPHQVSDPPIRVYRTTAVSRMPRAAARSRPPAGVQARCPASPASRDRRSRARAP